MSYNALDHFSYKFRLNLDKVPAKCSDRIALYVLLPGFISAVFLALLGFYELTQGLRPSTIESSSYSPSWFNLTFFDCVLVVLGLWIIGASFFSYFTYKKVFYDGKKVTLIYRSPFKKKVVFKETLKKYVGVRFRVEFFQLGLFNKNKYIIELYSKDADKIAPLYISTSGHNIRKIWEDYARKLNLPQVMTTDDGLAVRDVKDLGKSLIQLYKEGTFKDVKGVSAPQPSSSVVWVRKKDKSVIKPRHIYWDAYNILTAIIILLAALILIINAKVLLMNVVTTCFTLLLCFGIIYLGLKLITKDKLVVKSNKLIVVLKTLFFSRKKYEVMKDDVQTIDIAYSPVSERYFLAIIGKDRSLAFGKKLPLQDLRWVRDFVIHDIVKK